MATATARLSWHSFFSASFFARASTCRVGCARVLSAKSQNWPTLTRAHAPRHTLAFISSSSSGSSSGSGSGSGSGGRSASPMDLRAGHTVTPAAAVVRRGPRCHFALPLAGTTGASHVTEKGARRNDSAAPRPDGPGRGGQRLHDLRPLVLKLAEAHGVVRHLLVDLSGRNTIQSDARATICSATSCMAGVTIVNQLADVSSLSLPTKLTL